MSKCDIQVLNLLVHYGENEERVLVDLLEDGLLKILMKGPLLDSGKPCVAENVKIDQQDSHSIFLTGYFHREHTVKWRFSRNGSLPHKNPGTKDIFPQSRFVLDLNRHLLFWITQRGESYAPRGSEFKRYFTHYALQALQKKYRPIAESAYKKYLVAAKKTEESEKKITKARFVADFMARHHVTRKTFRVDLVPVVSTEKIQAFFTDPKYRIQQIKIFPKLPNPSNKDFEDLFPKTGQLASSADATAAVTLNAIDKEKGIKKAAIGSVIEKNQEHQSIDVEMRIQNTELSDAKPITVANSSNGGAVDVSLKFEIECKIGDSRLAAIIREKLQSVPTLTRLHSLAKTARVKVLQLVSTDDE